MGSNFDGNGVKAMPGLILPPKAGSFEYKRNTGSQKGHTKKKLITNMANRDDMFKNEDLKPIVNF